MFNVRCLSRATVDFLLASCLLALGRLTLCARRGVCLLLLLCALCTTTVTTLPQQQVHNKHTDSPIVVQPVHLLLLSPLLVDADDVMLRPPNSRVVWRRSLNPVRRPLTSARAEKRDPFLGRRPPSVTNSTDGRRRAKMM